MSEEPVPWYHCGTQFGGRAFKVEKILKRSPDSILSLSTSVKIQTMGKKLCLKCKGKNIAGHSQQTFCFAFAPQANFPAHNLNFH